MADEVKEMRGAIQHALVVLDLGKVDLKTLSPQALGMIEKMMVDSAIEDLKLTAPTELQKTLLEEAVHNVMIEAINGRQKGVSICMFPEEE